MASSGAGDWGSLTGSNLIVSDWGDFYNNVLSSVRTSNNAINKDPVGSGSFSFGDIQKTLLGGGGSRGITLPNGEEIMSSGSASNDLMRKMFGVSILDDSAKTVDGEAVAAGTGGSLGGIDFGSALARITIVILGFIFVAVGLSMFKDAVPVIMGKA